MATDLLYEFVMIQRDEMLQMFNFALQDNSRAIESGNTSQRRYCGLVRRLVLTRVHSFRGGGSWRETIPITLRLCTNLENLTVQFPG
jgi:hypothetical protein